MEVNSETDFVAQNEKFRTYVAKVANQALNSEATDIDAFMAEAWAEDETKTVKDALVDMIAVISEKLSIRRFQRIEENEGCVVSYLHGQGRIGVIVDAKTDVVNDDVKTALKNVAMQITSMSGYRRSLQRAREGDPSCSGDPGERAASREQEEASEHHREDADRQTEQAVQRDLPS